MNGNVFSISHPTKKYDVSCGVLTLHLNANALSLLNANNEFFDIIKMSQEEFFTHYNNNFLSLIELEEREFVVSHIKHQLDSLLSFSIKFNITVKSSVLPVLMAGHILDDGRIWATIIQNVIPTSVDEITGLYTMTKFQQEAIRLLKENPDKKYVIISTDFEKFKNANEIFGYDAGNRILSAYGKIIGDLLMPDELSCRYYADRFLALLTYEKHDDLIMRFKAFQNELLRIQGSNPHHFNLPVSCGVYYIEPNEYNIISIIDKAGIARKTIKGSHKNSFAVYDHEIRSRILHENIIESNMVQALENKEFVIYLQPKICLCDNTIMGAEALVRWQKPNNIVIPPNDFIPLFEKNGFIISLDFYVYEEVCKLLSSWREKGERLIPISINVSALHLKMADFVEQFNNLVNSYNIPHELLELELTESIFLDDPTHVCSVMRELKDLGYLLSIDDFGSGYSSLNVLKNIPADILKIDKDFFQDEADLSRQKTIVSYVIQMAKELDFQVLSEGVETSTQESFLKDNQCDMAQGYLFAKPMPIDEFEKLISYTKH